MLRHVTALIRRQARGFPRRCQTSAALITAVHHSCAAAVYGSLCLGDFWTHAYGPTHTHCCLIRHPHRFRLSHIIAELINCADKKPHVLLALEQTAVSGYIVHGMAAS